MGGVVTAPGRCDGLGPRYVAAGKADQQCQRKSDRQQSSYGRSPPDVVFLWLHKGVLRRPDETLECCERFPPLITLEPTVFFPPLEIDVKKKRRGRLKRRR